MNKSSQLLLLFVTVFLLLSSSQVECRRTYSSRSSSTGRGNRGKNQPSSGGLFSSWFGGSKSSGSSSGGISKPAPSSSSKKNWQTASSHATSQSKPSSGWANPYYKPSGAAAVPSAPKQATYGWKPATTNTNTKPVASAPSSNVGSRGYPVQSGVQQGSQSSFGGYKPASGVPSTNYQPAQSSYSGYRPASNVPGSYGASHHTGGSYGNSYHPPGTNYHPSGTNYHPSGSNYHPSQSHSYQPSHGVPHQPSYNPAYSGSYPHQSSGLSGHHPSYSGYSPHSTFGGAQPSYHGTSLFGGSSGHYGYPGSGSWGVPTYGVKKSSGSGTGKLLTGLAVGAAGGYLTSSLVNRISNPWKYSGFGYGGGYGYGSGFGSPLVSSYDIIRSRDESAFERGYERGVQARQNENNNNNKKETAAAPEPEDPTSKWIQCVAFDPQTQQTLINPNCSCTVTTSQDERTGQPLSVHHCTTLNGLVLRPIPVQPNGEIAQAASSSPNSGQTFEGANVQPVSEVNSPPVSPGVTSNVAPEIAPSYGTIYEGGFTYNGGATVYLPPRSESKVEPFQSFEPKIGSSTAGGLTEKSATDQSATEAKLETSTGTVKVPEVTSEQNTDSVTGEGTSEAAPLSGDFGGVAPERKRTAEFYGQLQKIVNMGNFVDGG